MMRASLWAVAVTACGVPRRARLRRKYSPRAVGLRYSDCVAQRSACAARLAPGPVCELMILPPVILFWGQRCNQDAKWLASGKRDRSGPSSANRVSAVLSPMPGMSVRSVPNRRVR